MNKLSFRRSGITIALSAVLLVSACSGTGVTDDPTTTAAGTPPPTDSPSAPTSPPVTTSPPDTVPSDTVPQADPLPTNAADYAAAAFDAWTAGDEDMLASLLTEEASEALRSVTVDPAADWEFVRCEGAAGSSHCSWMGPDGSLTFRVGNQAASAGDEHAITEVLVAGG